MSPRVIRIYKREGALNCQRTFGQFLCQNIFEGDALSSLQFYSLLKIFFRDFQFVFEYIIQLRMLVQFFLTLHSALEDFLIPATLFLDVRKDFDSSTHRILPYIK